MAVSNLGQPTASSGASIQQHDVAQIFTTGPRLGGYEFKGVSVGFKTAVGTPANLSVELWLPVRSGGAQFLHHGRFHEVGDLTNPSTIGAGTAYFASPAPVVLAPNAKYVIMVSRGGATTGEPAVVTTGDDDSGALHGWSIDGNGLSLDVSVPPEQQVWVTGGRLQISVDVDLPRTVFFSQSEYLVAEGESKKVWVTIDPPLDTASTVTAQAAGPRAHDVLSAAPDDDYTLTGDALTGTGGERTLTLPAGERSATFMFNALSDTLSEGPGPEVAGWYLIAPTGADYTVVRGRYSRVTFNIVDSTALAEPPPPATRLSTIWSATLTVRDVAFDPSSPEKGCNNGVTNTAHKCRTSSTLSDDDFTLGGNTIRVVKLREFEIENKLNLELAGTIPAAFSNYVLRIGSTTYPISSATKVTTSSGTRYEWSKTPTWTVGSSVPVSLEVSVPAADQPELTLSATDTAPREGGGPVTVTATLSRTVGNEVQVNVLLRGTATFGDGSPTEASGPDYRAPGFGEGSSDSVQAIELLTIPAGQTSASFTVHIVDDAHNDNGETIEIEAQAYEIISHWMKHLEGVSDRLTLTIANHEDAETEAARLAAEAAAKAERQRLAAVRAAAGGPLGGLALTAGSKAVTLVPAFSPGVTRYRAEVPAGTRGVSLAPSWGAEAELGGAPTVLMRSRRPVPHLTLLSQQQVHASGTAAALSLSSPGPTRLEVTVLEPDGSGKPWQATTTDYRIEVVEAAVPEEEEKPQTVTVAFSNVPPEHDGRSPFTVDVQSGSKPAAADFTVTNGKVKGVEPLDPVLWRVRVAPKSWKDVTVALGGASATVPGPARIRVEDARAKEGKDASLDFAVTLSRAASGPVSVDYATADGTAAAGADYTATSGTLTFAAGETEKTVSVPLLDDAIDEGKETFTLELSNPRGAFLRAMHREAKGVIKNDDPLQQAWLGRFGRAAASDAIAAVTARFETPRAAGSHLTFAGQRLDLSGDGAGLADAVAGLARAFGAEEAPATTDDPWNDPTAAPARSMSTRELLLGTSFRAVLGSGAGAQLTSWGQGASVSHFSGAVPGLSLSGESATGALGMDYERGALLAGFAMTHSLGEGTAHGAGQTWAMGSSVTTMLPYARFALSERISAWGMAGTGAGGLTLDLDDAAAQRYRTDLSMTLAAAGVRGELLTPTEASGFALALKADAFWVRTESDALSTPGVGNLAAARADATRLRAVLDGSRTFALASGATLAPSLELGVRHDGGDAETGTGLELGAGVGFADPSRGLDMALRVHGIAAHAGDGYREWGVSGSLKLAPGAAGRGLSMSLTPSYGADPGGSERLWALPDAHALAANGDAPASSRLDTELGYGLPVFGGGFTGTPNVGLGLSDTARDYRLGWRLTPAAGGDTGFELSLDAMRRESAENGDAEHGVMLRARTSW